MLHSLGYSYYGGENMTYYGAKNLADSFLTVRTNTLAIANEIPDDK